MSSIRKHIRLIESLMEAPISDIHLMGTDDEDIPNSNVPFSKGQTFDDVDQKLLTSKKGIAKIYRAFKKTPFNFEVYFINGNAFDGSDFEENDFKLGDNIKNYNVGVHDRYLSILGSPDKIKVVIVGNLSELSGKMPMTAWTLAHKIGHIFTESGIEQLRKYKISIMDEVGTTILMDMPEEFQKRWKSAPYQCIINSGKLSMKSARDGKIETSEVFPEIIAQYLISGALKLNLEKPEAIKRLSQINEMIYDLLCQLVGKVVVEL